MKPATRQLVLALLTWTLASGCAWRDDAGEHALVLGLGIVTTRSAGGQGPRATRTAALGLLLDSRGLLLGWRSGQTVELAPDVGACLVAESTGDRFIVDYRPAAGACPSPGRTNRGKCACEPGLCFR